MILTGLGEGSRAQPGISVFQESFHFLDPVFLYLLMPLAVLFVLWLVITMIKRIKRPQQTYGSRYPFIGKGKLWFFALLSGVLMIGAIAKPSLSQGSFKALRGDIEVILVVDRSISMRAEDIRPTRLDVAKREAFNVETVLTKGDKAALFVFGEESHKKIALSEKFSENIFYRLARVSFPKSLKGDALVWGSDFASMLENVYQSLDRQDKYNDSYSGKNYIPKKRTNRIVILFSDGEDQFKKYKSTTPEEIKHKDDYIKRLNSALSEFRKRGLKIYPVGVGTVRGVPSLSLLRGYKPDAMSGDFFNLGDYPASLVKEWKDDISSIDKNNLVFLARSTGTEIGNNIWTVENSMTTVKSYLSSIINLNRRILIEFSQSENDQDLWQYFLIAAAIILGIGILSYPVSGYFKKRK